MPDLDLELLTDGHRSVVVPAVRAGAARRRLRKEGLAVDVYGLQPGVAVDLATPAPAAWFVASLLEPSSWKGLLAQRAGAVVARTPLRRLLFRRCLVVGRAP